MPMISEAPDTLVDVFDNVATFYSRRAQGIRWRSDPVGWCAEKIKFHMWSKQREIAESVVNNKRTAVKSGHGVGKTAIAAALCQWWVETHIGEEVQVVTTAPSTDQVVGILWEYIRKSHAKHGLSGTVSEDAKWKDEKRNQVGVGRKPADGNTTSFQGRHFKYTLVIIDEACGIPADLFTAIDAIATTDTCRVVAIGNPTDPNTPFGNIFLGNGGRGLDAWNKLTISVLDNPNFTGEEVPLEVKEALSSKQWVADKIDEVGIDSMDYLSRVLGEFPETSEDSLFPIHLLYKATDNIITPDPLTPKWLGVDCARYGADSSAVVMNQGGKITILEVYKNADGPQSARKIHDHAIEQGVTQIRMDATAIGASVLDHLKPLCANANTPYDIYQMVGNAASPDFEKWLNARAYWHDALKKEMLHNRIDLPSVLGNPSAQRLFDELQGIKYKMNLVHASLQIESKEEMRRKGIKSPDISDAVTYAVAPINVDDPLAGYNPGDIIEADAYDIVDEFAMQGFVISPC